MQGWIIYGSPNSGKEWIKLDTKTKNNALRGKAKIEYCKIKMDSAIENQNKNGYYNQIKFKLTEPNSLETRQIILSGFELYGELAIYKQHKIVHMIKEFKRNDHDGLFHYLSKTYQLKERCDAYKIHSGALSIMGLKDKNNINIEKTENKDPKFVHLFLTQDRYIVPTDYAIQSDANGDDSWITGWTLECSNNNGAEWIVIDRKEDYNELKGKLKISFFEINPKLTKYNEFRLTLIQPMSNKTWELKIAGFEIYGRLYHYKEDNHININDINHINIQKPNALEEKYNDNIRMRKKKKWSRNNG
eukprot:401498_1